MASQMLYLVSLWFFNIFFITLILAKNEYDMTIEEYVKHINSPAVHKFQLENGHTVLCVRYEDQVSLRAHPEWTDTKRMINPKHKKASQVPNSVVGGRIKGCSEGTIPMLEITYEEVKAAGSVRQFLRRDKKGLPSQPSSLNNSEGALKAEDSARHVHAIQRWTTQQENTIVSASARFNLWAPGIDSSNGIFSLGQLWFTNNSPLQTIEIGWHVDPQIYSNDPQLPHLFVYWTANGYQGTGCYNYQCSGYVGYDTQHIGPGNALYSSVYDGEQKEIYITLNQEDADGTPAYVLYIDNVKTGYWPRSLFQSLSIAANDVDMGGEVCFHDNGQATITEMGSGKFPSQGLGRAAYVRQIEIRDAAGDIVSQRPSTLFRNNDACYDIVPALLDSSDPYWGVHFFYGGPGASKPTCQL
uniref:TSA: Wollemia nobilis Ref_Wollemi_Transcript_12890_1779 transcribed RNA sequence n=1 Tax=Wollemia nobilis TaxID=56998 RepID=A0A0C9RU54_9CONI